MATITARDLTARQLAALHGLYKGLIKSNATLYGVNVKRQLDALADRGVIARTGMGAYMIQFDSPGEAIIRATPDFTISANL